MLIKWILIILLLAHGLIHLLGGFSELHIAGFNNLSGETLLPLPRFFRIMFAAFWLFAACLFIVSSMGLAMNEPWWKALAVIAAAMSQIIIILWWHDAKWGTAINILIVLLILLVK